MFGAGYILSWDIVTWLAENRENLSWFLKIEIHEDQTIAQMLRTHKDVHKWWTELDYDEYNDYPGTQKYGPPVAMTKKMILVHKMKTPELLAHAIACFTGTGSCTTPIARSRFVRRQAR